MKKIKINGPIISDSDKWFYDYFEQEATCPNDVLKELVDNEPIEITINSGGGLVDSGNEIYTALKSHSGDVFVNVVMAGSAASIIAMAGSTIRMSPVGQMMIHNVSMGNQGDFHSMDKASEILQKANQSLASAYQIKTGKSKEEVLDLMDKETWLTADEAVELGFADEILFSGDKRPLLVADYSSGMISQNVINEMKELRNKIKVLEEKENMEEQKPTNESPFSRFLF